MENTMNDVSAEELGQVDGGGWLFDALKCGGMIAGGSGVGFELGGMATLNPIGAIAGAVIGGVIGGIAGCSF